MALLASAIRLTVPILLTALGAVYTERGGVFNIGLVHKDLPEELVYQVVKTVLEGAAELARAHPAAKAMDPSRALTGIVVPVHPGAERYYRETGVLK